MIINYRHYFIIYVQMGWVVKIRRLKIINIKKCLSKFFKKSCSCIAWNSEKWKILDNKHINIDRYIFKILIIEKLRYFILIQNL
jgi:hypothetical protein